jgi:hypothetical protein
MKTITPQYKALLEGKITKADFLTSARKQFPDYVTTMNSYQDTVTILKKKGLLSEVQDLDKSVPQLSAEGNKKPFYLVDETGDVIDSIMAVDSQEATDYFENEYEGIGSSLTVVHTSDPDELRGGVDEDIDKKDIDAVQAGALHEDDDTRDMRVFKLRNQYTPESLIKNLLWQGTDKWKSIDDMVKFVQKIYPDMDEDKILDAINAHKKAGSPTFSFKDDDLPFFEGKKKSLKEAEDKTEGSYKKVTGKDLYSFFNEIDRLNPYEVRKGINIEMGMQYKPTPNYFTDDFNPESLAKATRKVLKNLQKDPAYYTNMISEPTEKRTNMLQKPKELKVGPDGRAKVPGFPDAKSNTETNLGKKERAKGSPEGVKEMKPSKKSMGGLKTMKSNDKLPKGVELMKEADLTNSPGGLNAIGSDLAARAKEIYKAEEEFNKLMDNYDWYYEMSHDDRAWDHGKAVDRKLKELGKLIGAEKALEIFNKYAPVNRKKDDKFFAENVDMKTKLKDMVMKEVKKRLGDKALNKEAQKFKAGGETIFTSDKEAPAKKMELQKAGVKYTQSPAQ